MNNSHNKFAETISKVDNESCGISDENAGEGDHGIGKGKLRLICHS